MGARKWHKVKFVLLFPRKWRTSTTHAANESHAASRGHLPPARNATLPRQEREQDEDFKDASDPLLHSGDERPSDGAVGSSMAQALRLTQKSEVEQYDQRRPSALGHEDEQKRKPSEVEDDEEDPDLATAIEHSLRPARPTTESKSSAPPAPVDHPGDIVVSKASDDHDLARITQNAADVAKNPHGFSFVDRATEATDIAAINAYLAYVNGKGKTPETTVTHQRVSANQIVFTVNKRRYSTHGHSSQLYPLDGPGIVHGNGREDMIRVLVERGQLSVELYYKIVRTTRTTWNQSGRQVQAQMQAEFDTAMSRYGSSSKSKSSKPKPASSKSKASKPPSSKPPSSKPPSSKPKASKPKASKPAPAPKSSPQPSAEAEDESEDSEG